MKKTGTAGSPLKTLPPRRKEVKRKPKPDRAALVGILQGERGFPRVGGISPLSLKRKRERKGRW